MKFQLNACMYNMVKEVSQGCYLAKTDIKSAFRIIPIRPEDYPLLGMTLLGKFYFDFDKCTPIRCSSSCCTFECFSIALEWVAQHKLGTKIFCISWMIFWLSLILQVFVRCSWLYLGVPMAPEKTIGPKTVLSFAGIELDTWKSEAHLPQDKLSVWVC